MGVGKLLYLCSMEITDEAIVLHLSKYSDKASILHVYTRQYGRVAYMVYGLHSKSGKARAAVFEPMAHIELTANHTPTKQIQQLKEAHLHFVAPATRTDMRRRSVSLFLAEILYRTLLHPMADEPLFAWLTDVIQSLEATDAPENVHLSFLLGLTEYLGITPMLDESGVILDMHSGELVSYKPLHTDYFSQQETTYLHSLLNQETLTLKRDERQSLLAKLCRYYELHITDFQTPKSLAILEELFD